MIGFTEPRLWATGMLVATLATNADAFVTPQQQLFPAAAIATKASILLKAQADDEEGEEKKVNPYADPNYPDLEFVDYSDPEYKIDMGMGDEFFDSSSDDTEAQVEAMREERRVRNDEYQFETYYKEILKEGQEFKGEWTTFRTSTFIDGETDAGGRPRLSRAVGPFKVVSKGERVNIAASEEEAANSNHRLDFERILHHEKVYNDPDSKEKKTAEMVAAEDASMATKFWPEQLCAFDFRGQQGIMCVGNAYTICTGTPFDSAQDPTEGPYSTYSAELGIIGEDVVRFRVKLDYSVLEEQASKMDMPPLHLKSFTICRETLGMWPRADNYKSAIEAITEEALFGSRGAEGGLYDPPPVGGEEQAAQYLMLDLEGRATVLLPYLMDQDPTVHEGTGWVTTLDWTPGSQRYQLDRKTKPGKGILGLRTLELSEVQSADAQNWRPNDDGANMRQ